MGLTINEVISPSKCFVGPLFKLLSRLSLCSLTKKAAATAPATFLIPPMTWHQQRVLQCLRRVERIAVEMARMPWDTWLLCWLRVIIRWVIVPYMFFTYFAFVTFISKWIRPLKAKFLLACISVHTWNQKGLGSLFEFYRLYISVEDSIYGNPLLRMLATNMCLSEASRSWIFSKWRHAIIIWRHKITLWQPNSFPSQISGKLELYYFLRQIGAWTCLWKHSGTATPTQIKSTIAFLDFHCQRQGCKGEHISRYHQHRVKQKKTIYLGFG